MAPPPMTIAVSAFLLACAVGMIQRVEVRRTPLSRFYVFIYLRS